MQIELQAIYLILKKWHDNPNATKKEIGVLADYLIDKPANNEKLNPEKVNKMKEILKKLNPAAYNSIFSQDENNPMDLSKYNSISEWRNEMQAQGYMIPIQVGIGITKAMKKYNITFPEAYKMLEEKGFIIQEGKAFIYDMRGDNA